MNIDKSRWINPNGPAVFVSLFILEVGTEQVAEVFAFFIIGVFMFLLPKPIDWKG